VSYKTGINISKHPLRALFSMYESSISRVCRNARLTVVRLALCTSSTQILEGSQMLRSSPSKKVYRFCEVVYSIESFLARRFLSLVLKNDRTFAKQKFKSSVSNDAARWNLMMLTMVLYQHRAVNHFMITPRAILQWSSLDAREAICRSARAVIEEPQWK